MGTCKFQYTGNRLEAEADFTGQLVFFETGTQSGRKVGDVDSPRRIVIRFQRSAQKYSGGDHKTLQVFRRTDQFLLPAEFGFHVFRPHGLLGKNGTGCTFRSGFPCLVHHFIHFFKTVEHKLLSFAVGVTAFQQGGTDKSIRNGFFVFGNGHLNAQLILNSLGLAQNDFQDEAIHRVIQTVEHQTLYRRRSLAVAVHPAFPLFVAGRVPGKIVVDNSIKAFLQIDPFRQTVGSHQNTPGVSSQCGYCLFTLGRCKITRDHLHMARLKRFSQVLAYVVCSRNKLTEDNGAESVLNQRF